MSGEEKDMPGFDAIIMAGDKGAYRSVCGDNKAFLEVEGVPVILHVISALDKSRRVGRIFVVGPADRIAEVLRQYRQTLGIGKDVVVVEQEKTVLENARKAFFATLGAAGPSGELLSEEALRARHEDKAVLVLGSDMPLLTAAEVDEFIEKCDLSRYDYLIGMTPEEAMKPYYPDPENSLPGIHFPYFCFKDSKERQNNLHMARAFRILKQNLIQQMYQLRYQQRWRNILRLLSVLVATPGMTAGLVLRFLLLHVCRVLDRWTWRPLVRLQLFLRRFLDREDIANRLSRALGAPMGAVATCLGGAALDIDNEEHLQIIRARYRDWMGLQEALIRHRGKSVRPNGRHAFEPGALPGNGAKS